MSGPSPPRPEAVVAVVVRDGRFLVVRRGPAAARAGYWAPPSGRIEPGETQPQAVVRELREELGISVRPVAKVWECLTDDGVYLLHWWTAQPGPETPVPDRHEVAEVRWVSPEEFAVLRPTFDDDRYFLTEVLPRQGGPRATGRPCGGLAGRSRGGHDVTVADALVHRAAAGDEQAFRDLYRSVQPRLLRYLRVLVGDREAADVAAETWLHVVRDLSSFTGDDRAFRAWVVTIGRHRALDHLRRVRRRPAVETPAEVFDTLPAAGSGDDPADRAEAAVSTAQALALIARLPRDQAEAVLLRVVVGLDVASASRVLGKRPGAVRVAAHRGLRRLAGMLDTDGPGPVADGPATGADGPATGADGPATDPAAVTNRGTATLKGMR